MILIQGNTIYSPKFQNTELFYLKLCTLFRNFLISRCQREQAKLSVYRYSHATCARSENRSARAFIYFASTSRCCIKKTYVHAQSVLHVQTTQKNSVHSLRDSYLYFLCGKAPDILFYILIFRSQNGYMN